MTMNDIREQIRQKQREKARELQSIVPTTLFFQQNTNRLNVYKYITLGHVINEGHDSEHRIQGSTDIELQGHFPGIHHSTVRYERWQLHKKKWIEYAGFKRSTRAGKIKCKVWIITDKYKQYMPG